MPIGRRHDAASQLFQRVENGRSFFFDLDCLLLFGLLFGYLFVSGFFDFGWSRNDNVPIFDCHERAIEKTSIGSGSMASHSNCVLKRGKPTFIITITVMMIIIIIIIKQRGNNEKNRWETRREELTPRSGPINGRSGTSSSRYCDDDLICVLDHYCYYCIFISTPMAAEFNLGKNISAQRTRKQSVLIFAPLPTGETERKTDRKDRKREKTLTKTSINYRISFISDWNPLWGAWSWGDFFSRDSLGDSCCF